jgi:hypothetical protein
LARYVAEYPRHYLAEKVAQIRDNWPLARLNEAHAQVWFNGKVFLLRAHSSYGSVARRI